MKLIWLLIIYLPNCLLTTASFPPLDLVTTDEQGNQCVTKLKTCELHTANNELSLSVPSTGSKGDKGQRGLQGENGDRGMDGLKGSDGAKGDKGEKGSNGTMGPPGEKGDSGPPGSQGFKGDIGIRGDPGMDGMIGPMGVPGSAGMKGDTGPKGEPGPQGPPGIPGLMGSCPCFNPDVVSDETDNITDDEKFGTEEKPINVVCKDAPYNFIKGEEYYMGPWLTKITCETIGEQIYTCIPPKPISHETYTTEAWVSTAKREPFWLGINVKSLYGVTHAQIAWIQERSHSAFQKIKYHCVNTAPYNSTAPETSLLMVSWNDLVFGPKSSENTPFSYNVPPSSDGCLNTNSPNEPDSSIITIKSDYAYRLPVVDFLVRDVFKEDKKILIEHLELCFH